MIVQVKDADKAFGGQDVFKNLNLSINEREKVAIIGANGVGKTTLFKVLNGQETLDKGNVYWNSKSKVGFLDQIHLDPDPLTVEDYILEVFKDLIEMEARLQTLEQNMTQDSDESMMETYSKLQTEFSMRGGYTYHYEIRSFFTKFGFDDEDLKRDIHTFSGGQITRLAFIRLLLSKPDILFLDEPTNHLDISTIQWLEGYLSNYEGAVVLISHDRLFLDRVCKVVIEIEDMVATRYESNYSNYIELKEKAIATHNVKFQQQQKEIQRLEALIEKFRYKKNKAAFAQSKMKYLDRMDVMEKKEVKNKEFKAEFSPNVRGGNDVMTVDNFSVGYDKPLVTLSFEFKRGKRYAIVGDNGTGKSTLLKSISGKLEPLGGELLLGHQISIGYFDQQLLDFSMTNTVLEEVWDTYPQLTQTEVRQSLGRFLFKGEDVFKSVAVLSGGERVRLSLVKLMLAHDNLLILDEPTNHLDIPGKEALEKSLKNYAGTILFVSHDRYFIETIATDILRISDHKIEHTQKSDKTFEVSTPNEYPEKKEEKKQQYIDFKQLQRRIKKLEEELLELSESLELHRELRFDPDYYHDHNKMQELDATIDEIHNDIKQREHEWTELVETMEETQK
ncbi:ABC transporter ATP-binding protein [Erysipelothrix larvae]|uniref:ABC transporter ATP-binding protein n=1 Tax=Erysipelothrix larvae TaxID=1514105 RepID=A0A120JTJ1_9FIRM|nr:ABC-F family ATP-binding cassette domain-containing protein [Erysipelothrix larvae]AMC93060.1 ABC transporter ATP-binding protein [Erysipelothrix larvae]